MMIRTQVYLSKTDIDFLKDLALANKSTMSEELRKSLDKVRLTESKTQKQSKFKLLPGEFLLEMARGAKKLGFNGPKDLATNMDKYLYGGK